MKSLIALPGFMGTPEDWQPLLRHLSEIRGIFPVWDPVQGTLGAWISSLPALGVMGYSMGGRLALQAAVASPQKFPFLILLSTSLGIEEAAARRLRLVADEQWANELEAIDDPVRLKKFLRRWWSQPIFRSEAWPSSLWDYLLDSRVRQDPKVLAQIMREASPGRQPLIADRLSAYRNPVLVLAGAHDEKFIRLGHDLVSRLPNARFQVIPEAAHLLHLEAPGEVGRAIEEFLCSIKEK